MGEAITRAVPMGADPAYSPRVAGFEPNPVPTLSVVAVDRLSLSRGGARPALTPRLFLATPLLVWGHPLCGHSHAGARQWSSVMMSLLSSPGLMETIYSNSLGGIQSHMTGP